MDIDLSVQIDGSRTLWLTEVSRETFFGQGLESLENDSGLFVVLEDTTTGAFDILAKAASPASGVDLLNLFARMIGPRSVPT
ncbi:hypothetical protein [Oceaniradius stylonematis]|uniref:hypothetical protein n=1 Tax=Oceaniradius stylonematis TaxID=2184161 RepID=UPI00274019D6|nr:hypothetical protein [Oceaniradius stylonematis]